MADILNLRAVGGWAANLPSPLRRGVVQGRNLADRALARLNREQIPRELDEHRIETGEADEIAGR
jgi:hypothetical protein